MFLNGSNQVGLTTQNTPQQKAETTPFENTAVFSKNLQTAQGTPGLIQSLDQLENWIAGDAKLTQQCRWNRDKFPISIFVDSTNQPTMFSGKEFNMILYKALMTWQQTMPMFQWHMTAAAHQESADIIIRWQEETTVGRDFEVGHAKRTISNKEDAKGFYTINHVDITLINEPAIDKELSAEEKVSRLYATLLHELGHSFGLEHSAGESDIMFHQGWKNTEISEGDIKTIQTLYKNS